MADGVSLCRSNLIAAFLSHNVLRNNNLIIIIMFVYLIADIPRNEQ